MLLSMVFKMEPQVAVEKLRDLRRHFAEKPLFAEIVLRVLEDARATSYREEELLRVLNELSVPELYRHRARLVALGSDPQASHDFPRRLLETLTRIEAWPEAVQLTENMYGAIPSTLEMHVRKLVANRYRIAARYEAAISTGQLELLPTYAEEWRTNEREFEADRVAHERRRRPFPNISGTH
jgi:hypothetical protein